MERVRYSGKREIGGRVDLGWGDEDGEDAEETEKLANDVGKQQHWAISPWGAGRRGTSFRVAGSLVVLVAYGSDAVIFRAVK